MRCPAGGTRVFPRPGRDDRLVIVDAGGDHTVAVVRDLVTRDRPVDRARRHRARDGAGELVVVDDRGGVGVVEQVGELLVDVAVVDVHRHAAEQLRREERLEILGRVDQLDGDLVAGPQPVVVEGVGERTGAGRELAERRSPRAADDREPLGRQLGDRRPRLRERLLGHAGRLRARAGVPHDLHRGADALVAQRWRRRSGCPPVIEQRDLADVATLRHAPEGQGHEDRDQRPPNDDDDNDRPGNVHTTIMSALP